MIDAKTLKKDFPIFKNNPDLIYLDSAATSLKPKSVIDKLKEYYEKYSSNIYRGIYKISERATKEYEDVREITAAFINAKRSEEIIFTRNTTESINLTAYSLGRKILEKGDEIVTTIMEHHSNFVPWQQLALENGVIFKIIDINDEGYLDLNGLGQIITKKTKILALTYVSNVLGTINPIKKIVREAKKINPNLTVIVDAAQAIPHMKINIQDLGCDFLVFSSHKMFGPTGVGVLWGKYKLLDQMFPFQYGGEMIEEVYLDKTIFKKPPHKFEAGTPHIAGVIAFGEAIKYLNTFGFDNIRKLEEELLLYCFKSLKQAFGREVKIFGPKNIEDRGGVISFSLFNYHPHDIAQILDEENIAIRAGHHCAMPLHERLEVNSTARTSFYIYNSKEDVDKLINGLKKVTKLLG